MDTESLRELQRFLARIDGLIQAAVARAQALGSDPADTLRGLVISHEEIDTYLKQPPLSAAWSGETLPLLFDASVENTAFTRLAATFNLSSLDCYIFLLALAPELDRRYERFYAYLQDDISQRRPTVHLMMNFLGNSVEERFAVWERLLPRQPLRYFHLVDCFPDSSRQNPAFLGYQLKVDQRVVAHLLGDDAPDERLKQTVRRVIYDPQAPLPELALEPVYAAFPESPMLYFKGAAGMGQVETAAMLCAGCELPLARVDLAGLAGLDTPLNTAWPLALREAYLAGAALMVEGWEQPAGEVWESLVNYPLPVFICGQGEWEPADEQRERRLLRLNFSVPDYEHRLRAWQQQTRAHQAQVSKADLQELANKFRFTDVQIARAVHSAVDRAVSRGERANKADLYAGAQAHSTLKLANLATRINPRYGWENLILPPDQLAQLRELTQRVLYSHIVHDQWGFGGRIARTRGVSALFAGESGTGKTLAAEVIARDLGLVLYKIDLSAVVSKYIGETEKNLNVIFTEAYSSNAILFFDEADALFGKRSEVKDARDRYANIEIAYLLQQVENYDGIVVLATNFRQNIDEAFTRRLDFLIDFPFPDEPYREKIWAAHFPPEVPIAPDVNLSEIAGRYRLAGGNIRNAALAAAYLAAADGGVITAGHIRSAIRRENQKMGRLVGAE
jgi:hypothetical protein